MQAEIPTEYYQGMMRDALIYVEEHWLPTLDAILRQKEQVANAYNKRVKMKKFIIGDLV